MSQIVDDIRKLKTQYDDEIILTAKGNSYTQRGLINLIESYWDSKFINSDRDKTGLYNFFYNVIKFPTRIASKIIDFDTKDFRFIAEQGQSYVPVWLFNKELKAWMKDQDFGYILNRIVKNTPKYGNHIVKSVNGDVKSVHFRDIVCDPYVERLDDSYLVVEEHYMTPNEIKKMKNWENVDKVMKVFEDENQSYIRVDECYIYGEKGYFDGSDSKEFVRGVCFIAGLDDYKKDDSGNTTKDNHIKLFSAVRDKIPYYEFYWDDYQGTYIRTGIPLELLEEQMSQNDAVNMERRGLYWTSKKIYQTRDMLVKKNLMTDVDNGDILRVSSEVTPVANEERNLAAFRNNYDIWDKNRREKTMTFESVSGETMPAATPFRLGFIQQKAASGYFDFQREDIGLMLKRFITEVIVPTFKSRSKGKHSFNLYGEDSEYNQIAKTYVEFQLYNQLKEYLDNGGRVPQPGIVDLERQRAMKRLENSPSKVLEIPEGYYEDLKYKMDLIITGESINLDSKVTTMTTALQTIATNPGILQNPATRKIFLRLLDMVGVNPEELGGLDQAPQGQMQQPLSPPPGPAKTAEIGVGTNVANL